MTPAGGRERSAGAPIELHVVEGRAAGSVLEIGQELVLGRDASEAGRLGDDPELSRRHARLTDGGRTVEDLGSTNGTFLNGRRVDRAEPLPVGATLRVGQTTIEVRAPATAEAGQALGPRVAPGPARVRSGPTRRFPWKPLAAVIVAGGALAAVLLLASSGSPPEQDPAAVERVEEAVAAYYGAPGRACDHLTTQAVAATYGSLENCRQAFEDYAPLDVTTEDVTIERRDADARVTTSDGRVDDVELAEDPDGDWQIDEISSKGS